MTQPTRHDSLLRREGTGLILVDIQDAFAPVIDRFDEVVRQAGLLTRGMVTLGRPVLVSEQYPKGLGSTVGALVDALPEDAAIIEKIRFSASGVEAFDDAIAASGCTTWVVAGVETHVCVNQTALDLMARGHRVHVAADAVGSRTASNRELGLRKMEAAGALVTSVETALFEMLEQAGGDAFKAISRLVR